MGSEADNGQTQLIAKAFGVTGGVPFAAVAYVLFESYLLAGVLLVTEGIGSYYLLTYVFAQNEEVDGHGSPGGIHEGALGFGLSIGSVSMLAGAFADVGVPDAIAGGLLVATVAYVVLSFALPPVKEDRAAL
ncbi:hypothetical protein G9464_05180 [Halostella sp. JP-L12]|uniref:hypothetical protein n=1 Tax=Halostella TaxID=1843185 RepID=UPI000EF7C8D6|nr:MULTISPECIES: hypothetical protein [Halostella]NHN46988.1 hypothetical protein [Halostella sp. JP-L12]